MTDAPERIWLGRRGCECFNHRIFASDVKYIRADIHKKLVEVLAHTETITATADGLSSGDCIELN